uniref:Uncharacterized protein n=1 Tax=Rhizophora mucronata TaxID=61149 RepID=A0A2P2Q2K8_RHIMU
MCETGYPVQYIQQYPQPRWVVLMQKTDPEAWLCQNQRYEAPYQSLRECSLV